MSCVWCHVFVCSGFDIKRSIVYQNLGDKLINHPNFGASANSENGSSPLLKRAKQVCLSVCLSV